MADEETTAEPEVDGDVDEHGLAIQRYESTVLLVVPASGYSEETMRYARSSLYNVHVGTRTVSTEDGDLIKGRLQDEFQADGPLEGESLEPYSGVLFVDGEAEGGTYELANHPVALRLAQAAATSGKLLGAWGEAVQVLVNAGVVRKRKLTGPRSLEKAIKQAGGKYTGNQVERDGALVTAFDDAAGLRFGKLLVQVVAI